MIESAVGQQESTIKRWLRLATGSGPALALSHRALDAIEREPALLLAGVRALVGRLAPEELASVILHRRRHAPPAVREAIDAALEQALGADDQSLDYALSVALDQVRRMRQLGVESGVRVLELGSGGSMVGALVHHVHGATLSASVDMVEPLRCASLYRRLRRRLTAPPLFPLPGVHEPLQAPLARFDAAIDLARDPVHVDPARIAPRWPVDAAALPFPEGAFDVVLSNAAFEHFADPRRAIAETYRVLAPGGVGLHQIDLRDHRDFARPLEFLRMGEQDWRARAGQEGVEFTNRWRKHEFARSFAEAGFAAVEVEVIHSLAVGPEERSGFAAPFRDLPLDDLQAGVIHLTARKSNEQSPGR